MYMYVYLFIYIYIYIICNIYFHEPSTWRRQDASTANRMFFSLEVGPEFTQCIINEHLGDERRTKWDQPMGPSYDKLEILNAWIEVGLTNLITLSPKIMVNLENGCIWNMITIGNTANISLHWSMIMGRKSKYLTASLFFCWIFFQVTDWPLSIWGVFDALLKTKGATAPWKFLLGVFQASFRLPNLCGKKTQPGRCELVVL